MNSDNELEQIATIASNWWSSIISKPKCKPTNNIQQTIIKALAETAITNINEQDLSNFNEELKQYIFQRLKDQEDLYPYMILGCDYGPDTTLKGFADKNNISELCFPWKTVMEIGKNYCGVACGYGAPKEVLYANEDYYDRQAFDYKSQLDYLNSDLSDSDDYRFISRETLISDIQNKYDEAVEKLNSIRKDNAE